MAPFLRHRAGDRWWRLSLGLLWLPAIVVLLTVEDWVHLSGGFEWISLGVLFVGFLVTVFVIDRKLD